MATRAKPRSPLDREAVVIAALGLLNRHGVEKLTLRALATELRVQAPALYWHFKSKQDLLDEMATHVLREGFFKMGPAPLRMGWAEWCRRIATAERAILLQYRDGARMFSGTYLTDAGMYASMEASLAKLVAGGFTLLAAMDVLSTLHCYVVGFTIEEQAVWPAAGKRDPRYSPEQRSARIDAELYPLVSKLGDGAMQKPDERFARGLEVILRGLAADPLSPKRPAR